MDSASSRPRRSRFGLIVFLLVLALVVWEVVGRANPALGRTPGDVARAVWAVAGGGTAGVAGGPSAAEVARMAYRPLPYVMFGLKPGWEREGDLRKTSNALGFRGAEVVLPKPPGRYRILCLGGSTTYSETVADADAYPALLQGLLREARPARDIEVVNCGVPSYTTAETLASLAFRCLELQPDAIVLYEGINDYRPREYGNFDPAYVHYRKIWDGGTRLYEKGEGELAGGINPFVQNNYPSDNGDKDANARRAGSAAFRRNLTSIAGVAKAHGVALVLVSCTWDEGGGRTSAGLAAGIAEHNQVVRDVAQQQGALFIDLAGQFQGAGQFADPVHMNPEGSLQMARIIADGLLAGLL